MSDRQRFHKLNICPAHLLQWEIEVEEGLLSDQSVQLPFHDIGGEPLDSGQAGAIELAKFSDSRARALNAVQLPTQRERRQLPLELILLLTRECARARSEVRI